MLQAPSTVLGAQQVCYVLAAIILITEHKYRVCNWCNRVQVYFILCLPPPPLLPTTALRVFGILQVHNKYNPSVSSWDGL